VAADGAAGDEFGYATAISGNRAVVGAYLDDDGGEDSGSVFLFDVTTGAQLAKLTADDATAGDRFGSAIAISGNIAIIGAPTDSGAGLVRGSAYLFDVTNGVQLGKLTSTGGTDYEQFGSAVAIDDNIAVIGAPKNECPGGFRGCGCVYVFDVTTGAQLAQLTASDRAPGWMDAQDEFGSSVAISGNTVLIGAPNDQAANSELGPHPGAAYLFDLATGGELVKLTLAEPGSHDDFGVSVAISESKAVIGTRLGRAAYLFSTDLGSGTPSADFNNDGLIDAGDLAEWTSAFPQTTNADADEDGDSDGADFLAWQRQLGDHVPVEHLPVPEPSPIPLAAAAIAAAGNRRVIRSCSALNPPDIRRQLLAS
jgi:hypothetical protein